MLTRDLVYLENGPLRLSLAPHGGARILSFSSLDEAGEWHWFRAAKDEHVHPVDSASYPLVPFSNRIDHGRFTFDGVDYALPANFPPEPHAVHGVGWHADWDIIEQSQTAVSLRIEHAGDEAWPWSFSSSQQINLSDSQLVVTMTLTNTSDRPMPGGLGQHPHFAATDDMRLTARIASVVEKAADGILPGVPNPEHPAVHAMASGAAPMRGLDTDLLGWDGTARIDWPDAGRSMEVSAPGIRHVVYYSPSGRGFVCFEPVSHASNALATGAEAGGIRILAPGEEMEMSVSYRVL